MIDELNLFFYKGKEDVLEKLKKKEEESEKLYEEAIKKIQGSFEKVLDTKNLSFLLGSGCSSYELQIEGEKEEEAKKVQVGIDVMAPLALQFYTQHLSEEEKKWLQEEKKLDFADTPLKANLELFLSSLHSLSFFYENSGQYTLDLDSEKDFKDANDWEKTETVITKARKFLLKKCLNIDNSQAKEEEEPNDKPLLDLYKRFYRKLLTRNSTLPKVNIFTTNYDLYSERAMDSMGIQYVNGFTGGIDRFFNPAIFNYALAEKMDLSQSKWSVIDNFFYLYKIHGSVNWVEAEEETKLFNVRELQNIEPERLSREKTIMIHPTPLKYQASLGSPYSDLFREFQKKLMQSNNILVTVGYSFNDEHINNLIFQAFTIPSFRLVIIGEPTGAIGSIQSLDDSRIWIIGGEFIPNGVKDVPLHFFKRFVDEILPDLTNEDIDRKVEQTIQGLKKLLND